MDQLAVARRAIEDEIAALSAEVARLEAVLGQLGGNGSVAPYAKYAGGGSAAASKPASAGAGTDAPVKRRGRPKGSVNGGGKAAAATASSGDLSSALSMIKEAGKKGIKALALASAIKKAGGTRPSKEELLGTDKIKMTGRGGGTTYTFVG